MAAEKIFDKKGEDRKLILVAQKDPRAFRELYSKYEKNVYKYFLFRVDKNNHIAEDLTQDTFYRALKYLKTFRITGASYLTYLLRIAHNILVNYYRRKKAISIEDIAEPRAKEDYMILFEKYTIWESVEGLIESEKQIIIMKYKEGLSVREISVVLNKSENAVKLHLSRARKKLKQHLTDDN